MDFKCVQCINIVSFYTAVLLKYHLKIFFRVHSEALDSSLQETDSPNSTSSTSSGSGGTGGGSGRGNGSNHCGGNNKAGNDSADALWARMFMLQPTSSLLTSLLVNSGDLKQLAVAYANTLPLPLREIMSRSSASGGNSSAGLLMNTPYSTGSTNSNSAMGAQSQVVVSAPSPTTALVTEENVAANAVVTTTDAAAAATATAAVSGSDSTAFDAEIDSIYDNGVPAIPTWGTVASVPLLHQQQLVLQQQHGSGGSTTAGAASGDSSKKA